MDNEYNQQRIKDLELDVADQEAAVKGAEIEVKDAREWLAKCKLRWAEDIIRLNDAKKEL